jgi:hypothetical protein
MDQMQLQADAPIRLLDWLKLLPFKPAASSDRLGWVGLEAASCRAGPVFECTPSVRIHHRLFLFTPPPNELDLRYEGVTRNVPPPAGSISLIPAGSPARVHSSGCKDELHIADGRDAVAVLALDAQAAMLGTRFLASARPTGLIAPSASLFWHCRFAR